MIADQPAAKPAQKLDPESAPYPDSESTSPGGSTKPERQSDPGAGDPAGRIADLEKNLAEVQNRLLRNLADEENTRRRMHRERDEAVRFAISGFARDLLPVLDNLGRAIESFPGEDVPDESVLSLLRGVAAIERQMVQAFQQNGIQRFDPVGETFDPHLHQAVLQRPDAKVEPGTVVEVLQPGYRHHDRLLRPASVGVAADHDSGSQR